MKFSNPNTETLDLNLAPLIDVVFLLLIFFMVTTSFNQQKALDLQLPEASAGGSQAAPSGLTLNISVSENNNIALLNDKIQIASIEAAQSQTALSNQIQKALNAIKDKNPALLDSQATIVIEADKNASHGRVIQLMDAISNLGINQIQFAVEAPQ